MIRILLLYIAILAFLTLNPWIHPDSRPIVGSIPWDKFDHAIAYGLLACLTASCFRFYPQKWVLFLIVFLICSWVGLFFEYCQLWFTATRAFSLEDAIANVVGVIFGLLLCSGYWLVTAKRAN